MIIKLELAVNEFTAPTKVNASYLDVPTTPRTSETLPEPTPVVVVPLNRLDTKTLENLCENFRKKVFENAGREAPKTYTEDELKNAGWKDGQLPSKA